MRGVRSRQPADGLEAVPCLRAQPSLHRASAQLLRLHRLRSRLHHTTLRSGEQQHGSATCASHAGMAACCSSLTQVLPGAEHLCHLQVQSCGARLGHTTQFPRKYAVFQHLTGKRCPSCPAGVRQWSCQEQERLHRVHWQPRLRGVRGQLLHLPRLHGWLLHKLRDRHVRGVQPPARLHGAGPQHLRLPAGKQQPVGDARCQWL